MPAPGSLVVAVGKLMVEFQSSVNQEKSGLTPVLDTGFTRSAVHGSEEENDELARMTATSTRFDRRGLLLGSGECCSAKSFRQPWTRLVPDVGNTFHVSRL